MNRFGRLTPMSLEAREGRCHCFINPPEFSVYRISMNVCAVKATTLDQSLQSVYPLFFFNVHALVYSTSSSGCGERRHKLLSPWNYLNRQHHHKLIDLSDIYCESLNLSTSIQSDLVRRVIEQRKHLTRGLASRDFVSGLTILFGVFGRGLVHNSLLFQVLPRVLTARYNVREVVYMEQTAVITKYH